MLTQICFVFSLFGCPLRAQQIAPHHGPPAADYRFTEMPPPPVMTGIGSSLLKITTQSADAQRYFAQGVALLHCFWEFEAYRAFKEASRRDPDAAMAYWGIVQSVDGYSAMDDVKKSAIEKIKNLISRASDQEQFYLRAVLKQQENDGDEAYHREMEALVDKYPNDLDAWLFLAMSLPYWYDSDGRPNYRALYPITIVKNVLAGHPDNPAANHYLIHLLEAGPNAAEALNSAEILGRLAPGSGHMVHMPGHIYFKLGDQSRARAAFLSSMRVDQEYMRNEHVDPIDDWNYAHNLSYLVASDAEAGRYKEALEMAARLDQLPPNPFLASGRPTHAVTLGATSARLAIRFGNWQEAIYHPVELGDGVVAGASARLYRDGLLAYARGMQAIAGKDFLSAGNESNLLDALQWRLNADLAGSSHDGAKADSVFKLLETFSLDLRGNLECAQGRLDPGMALLQKAAENERKVGYGEPPTYSRPESESMGYAWLAASQFSKAREAFDAELTLRPRSGHALYGIARSYELSGDRQAAARAYAKFLESWKDADRDLPMVQHARSIAR